MCFTICGIKRIRMKNAAGMLADGVWYSHKNPCPNHKIRFTDEKEAQTERHENGAKGVDVCTFDIVEENRSGRSQMSS